MYSTMSPQIYNGCSHWSILTLNSNRSAWHLTRSLGSGGQGLYFLRLPSPCHTAVEIINIFLFFVMTSYLQILLYLLYFLGLKGPREEGDRREAIFQISIICVHLTPPLGADSLRASVLTLVHRSLGRLGLPANPRTWRVRFRGRPESLAGTPSLTSIHIQQTSVDLGIPLSTLLYLSYDGVRRLDENAASE
ncbi:hypothetical protein EDB86DRAFT_987888 [Lactarius hatsudake]|nr:hypothetical protein EDB86DRAFT_987888 [Lactarius hatsudake]